MPFDLGKDLEAIHQPARLRIMSLLFRERDIGFAQARAALGLTDGNLGAHTKVLEGKGFVRSRRTLVRNGFQVRIEITDSGADAFRRYVAALERFVQSVPAEDHEAERTSS